MRHGGTSRSHLFRKVWRDVRTYQPEVLALHQIGVHGDGGVWLSALRINLIVLPRIDEHVRILELKQSKTPGHTKTKRPPATLPYCGGQSSMTQIHALRTYQSTCVRFKNVSITEKKNTTAVLRVS